MKGTRHIFERIYPSAREDASGAAPRMKNRKSRLFLSWVLSYAFISIFPILIGSYVYIKSVETIHYEVNRMEYMSLQQLKSILDGKFDELDRTLSNISLNQDVKYLMSSRNPLGPKDILKIINVQRDLSKFKLSNSNIEEIYIYLNNNDSVFSSVYKYNGSDIKDICFREFLLGYDEFSKLVHAKNYRYLRILKSGTGTGIERNKVILMQSLYLNNLNTPAGTLIISFDGDKLIQLLKNLELADSGEVILVDSKDEFYSTGSARSLPDYLGYGLLKKTDVTFYKAWNSTDTAVTHLSSDTLDLEYISLIPSKVFLSKVQYIKSIIFIYVCICLMIGGVAAVFLARRNFSPVARLKQMLIRDRGKSDNQEGNEFKFLENSLKGLLDENKSIAANLKQQNAAQRNNFLSRLLKGRIGSKEALKESLDTYEIRFDSEYFLVAAFGMEDPKRKLFEGAVEDEEAINIVYYAIKNTVEEMMNEKYKAYAVETDGMMALIVNAAEGMGLDQDVFKSNVSELLAKAVAFIENGVEIILSVFVSDIHYGLQGIRQAYAETLQVLEYKTLVGEEASIIRYDSIHADIASGFNDSYNLEKERLFANCIAAEDYKSAREILDDLLSKNLNRDIKSIQLMKCRVFGLINITLDAIGEIRTGSDVDFIDDLDPVNRLLNSKSIIDLKTQVDFIFDKIMEYYSERTGKQTPDWIVRVEDYIKMHFVKPDLSITVISDHIGISVSYLSRVYKKYRGIGLLDYIHKVRLERAKELLESDKNIKDIALQVGYLESKALIRSFKRYEGITPGRYKETLANKGDSAKDYESSV